MGKEKNNTDNHNIALQFGLYSFNILNLLLEAPLMVIQLLIEDGKNSGLAGTTAKMQCIS